MSFLRPFLADRQQITNQSDSSETDMLVQEEDSQDVTSPASILSAPSTPKPNSSASDKSGMSAGKRSYIKKKENTLSSAAVLQDYLAEKSSRRKCTAEPQLSSDPINKFFDCMAETLKTFPRQLQIEVKSKIFGIVSDAETKCMNLSPINSTYSQGEAAFAHQPSQTTSFYQHQITRPQSQFLQPQHQLSHPHSQVTMPQPPFLQMQYQMSNPQPETHHPSAIQQTLHSQSSAPFCQQRTTAATPLRPPPSDYPEDISNINDDNNDIIQCI